VDEIVMMNGGKGIDLIIDFIGGPYFTSNLKLAAHDGKIVNLGLLGGPFIHQSEPVNMAPFVMKRLRYEGSTLRSRDLKYQMKVKELFEEKALLKLVNGTFKNVITRVFKWEDIQKAHELMESNSTMGKIVCTIDL
jgi:NADPH:quinone reductase-like Zn-dependent oxidoreductase